MKTILKTLICTALCGAAWSAFAGGPPPPSTTTMTFKAPQASPSPTCGGATVGSVSLNGAGTPDVAILTTTYLAPTPTPPASPTPVSDGKVQLKIATDGLGNPTSVALNQCWVNLNDGGTDVDTNGQVCFPVDLDGLSTLGLTDCNGNPLQDVTCDTGLVGFQAHYIGQGNAGNSTLETDLTIECDECGTNTHLTIGLSDVDGQGSPPPGYSGCWEYTLTVQNCTPFDLTGVKAQGGTAGWLNAGDTSVTATSGTATITYNRRNQVITWIGNRAQGESVDITVHVCGTIKPSTACGTIMFLSGPWSATYTDPNTGLPVKTDYTGRAQLTVTCPP
jgi:hypothetical protein